MSSPRDVTVILHNVSEGNRSAADELLPLVYGELRRLAQHHLKAERSDHTLQATALVHEAYLRLVDQTRTEWKNRAHFFAIAAQAIRRVLIDHARSKGRAKRGGGAQKLSLDDVPTLAANESYTDLLALDDTLEALAKEHARPARVVEMRFYAGLTTREVAEVLGVSTRTVEADWQFARAWLYGALTDGSDA